VRPLVREYGHGLDCLAAIALWCAIAGRPNGPSGSTMRGSGLDDLALMPKPSSSDAGFFRISLLDMPREPASLRGRNSAGRSRWTASSSCTSIISSARSPSRWSWPEGRISAGVGAAASKLAVGRTASWAERSDALIAAGGPGTTTGWAADR